MFRIASTLVLVFTAAVGAVAPQADAAINEPVTISITGSGGALAER